MENELYHHGIKGQRWGVRRFQNKDGSLTEQGIKRYMDRGRLNEKGQKAYKKAYNHALKVAKNTKVPDAVQKAYNDAFNEWDKALSDYDKEYRKEFKKAAKESKSPKDKYSELEYDDIASKKKSVRVKYQKLSEIEKHMSDIGRSYIEYNAALKSMRTKDFAYSNANGNVRSAYASAGEQYLRDMMRKNMT